MANSPNAGSISTKCPNPEIEAHAKKHFGQQAWEWNCPHVKEGIVAGKGIEITCRLLNQPCCIDDNQHYFVNPAKSKPLRGFLTATLQYFSMTTEANNNEKS